jgi:predicted lysophospholipase L1 biosynthesis ABC-type transport system permease subunit
VPVVATDAALAALRLRVGDSTRLALGPLDVDVRITGAVRALPGTTDPAALLADLPSLATAQFADYGVVTEPGEWWLATRPGEHVAAAAAVAASGGVQVRDRLESARAVAADPYGRGARLALFAAASGAVLLAGLGLVVDARATARRRSGELAVLHTLGAGPRTLARSLVAEHGVLAGVGLIVGVLVGIGVAATLAPLVILTSSGSRPVPTPLLHVPWVPVLLSAAMLAVATLALSALTALTVRRRLAAMQLRVGAGATP